MAVPQRPLDDGYRIGALVEMGDLDDSDVIRFWEGEGVVTGAEARRRVDEVLLVATGPDGSLAGVSSAYLAPQPQLAMDLWHFRVYVAERHRRSNAAVQLAVRARARLEERFVSGADTRGQGVLYEVESGILKGQFREGMWPQTQVAFIGEDEQGAHIRVRYFPGALVPSPPAPAG